MSTPMQPDGTVNLPALAMHARWALDNGCDSITLFGTTGEAASLTMAERERMLGAVLGTGIEPGRQLLAGVLATSVGEAAEQASMAYDAGARGLLVMPPYYFKGMGDDGLFAWYAAFIERLKGRARELILYHIPSQSATPLSVELVGRLKAAYPGVVTGVKDSSADWPTQEAFLKAHGDLAILVGDETLLARSVQQGGEGSICGVANIVPGWLRPMVYEGREDPRVNALVKAIVSMPIMSAVKALAAHVHGAGSEFSTMRAPLPALTEAQRQRLIEAYEDLMKQKAA
jgi:4-hydroxy-tetrahydrodipicolinate synthase